MLFFYNYVYYISFAQKRKARSKTLLQTVKKGESLRQCQNPLNQRTPVRFNRGFWHFLDLHFF